MKTVILPPEQWGVVAPIVTGVFHNEMPETEKQAIFLTAFDDQGELRAFAHLEVLLHVSSVWVRPEERSTRTIWQLMQATDELLQAMPGFSAIAMPNRDSHRALFKRLHARSLGSCEVWRKDY